MSSKASKFDLVISGVGGQGAILASDIIGKSAVLENYNVRAAETHGMAQRGGSVVNHVRIGCDLGSMIPLKGADCLLALEPVEALRYIDSLADDGVVIMNTEAVHPVTVTTGKAEYPDVESIVAELRKTHRVIAFNATEKAAEAGSRQAMNVVLVGAVSNFLPIKTETLLERVKEMVPPKTIDTNVKAFEMGRSMVE
ncbi:indolepyruvate oxidoreductase subunit beta [Methanococcoides alaskense]|uniref:Indolepyruvate ferredoxin oxidoreductase subunit beta n=1 Tax=Methanococcoides alaskense TaxID=325778 RepID=A0AA90Z638_9EURY|nr:indolepyruvate oxidoreductase subunit beta [Methanococcoides alaskense]MDA0525351.1 indolepyruvate oxidoreductase subunit beta [Methanococcoides alaskense]MDR6221719.1 indolepyruvate ferredoxin oxidoreductase beta subunit [Methanococcoides alaskense]